MKNFNIKVVLLITILFSNLTYGSELINKKPEVIILDIKEKMLIEKAKEARENAYCPYSNFKVGAALLTKTGEVFTGVNVENLVQAPGSCAERTAIVKAVSEGFREFKAIAIVANTDGVCAPCGVCRQVILEFGTNIDIIMTNTKGDKIITKKITDLVPYSFSPADLEFNDKNPQINETPREAFNNKQNDIEIKTLNETFNIIDNAFYKIVTQEQFNAKIKEINKTTLDKKTGFIHLSLGTQVKNVINKFFKNDDKILVIEIDKEKLIKIGGTIKIESNKSGGTEYPHLYNIEIIPSSAIKNIIKYNK